MRSLLTFLGVVVGFPLFAASGMPVVAIGGIESSAQNISCKGWDRSSYNCNQDLADGFRRMLETSITKSGKMRVYDRGDLGQVLEEQSLGEVGLTDGGGLGGLTGVDYLVVGAITRFGSAKSGLSVQGGGLLGRRTGRMSQGKLRVAMGVDLKVTDVATGRIVVADEVSGEVSAGGGFSVGGVTSSQSSADPFADVQRVVASKIAEAIVTSRIPVKIIGVQSDGLLVLNYGNVFFGPGDVLAAFAVGESFVDPDTGAVLGAEETLLGTVTVVSSDARMSRAESGAGAMAAGTVLRRSRVTSGDKPERRRAGSSW